jgi:hypothetical protein
MRTTQRLIRTAVIRWLPLACVATALAGLVYLAVQQTLRLSANDPQIQLAEDAGAALAAGQPPQSVLPGAPVDLATSLRPYVIVLSDSGELVASSATLHGQSPVIPTGVLAYAREHGEERVTWQPEAGVRSAAVIVRYAGSQPGFVLAGRSLREVEYREQQMLQLVAVVWLATLLVSFVGLLIAEYLARMAVPDMVTA